MHFRLRRHNLLLRCLTQVMHFCPDWSFASAGTWLASFEHRRWISACFEHLIQKFHSSQPAKHFCTSGRLLCDVRLVAVRLTTTDKITRFPHASHVLSRKLAIGCYRLNLRNFHLVPRKGWRWLFPSNYLLTTLVYKYVDVLWFEALACYRLEQESQGRQCKHCGVQRWLYSSAMECKYEVPPLDEGVVVKECSIWYLHYGQLRQWSIGLTFSARKTRSLDQSEYMWIIAIYCQQLLESCGLRYRMIHVSMSRAIPEWQTLHDSFW